MSEMIASANEWLKTTSEYGDLIEHIETTYACVFRRKISDQLFRKRLKDFCFLDEITHLEKIQSELGNWRSELNRKTENNLLFEFLDYSLHRSSVYVRVLIEALDQLYGEEIGVVTLRGPETSRYKSLHRARANFIKDYELMIGVIGICEALRIYNNDDRKIDDESIHGFEVYRRYRP